MGTTVYDEGKTPSRRGCWFYLKRGLLALAAAVIALPLLGLAYQSAAEASARQAYPPPGEFYLVGDHRLHLRCMGEGSPTIILEAGAYSYSSEWHWVQPQLAEAHRVCAYDRAGNGWSEAGPMPRDGRRMMDELHQLLELAGEEPPYILVGHSLGGLLAAIYAGAYPGEAQGVVTVDSAIPLRWATPDGYEQWKTQNESAYGLMSALVRFGLGRIIIQREFSGYGYPEPVSGELTALKANQGAVETWDAEFRLAQWELGQQVEAAHDLGAMPLVILWASHPEITAAEDRERLEAIWSTMPLVSSNQSVRIVEGADHGSIVGNDRYARQVTAAVLDVIEAAQTGQPLET